MTKAFDRTTETEIGDAGNRSSVQEGKEAVMSILREAGVKFEVYELQGDQAATVESAARSIGVDPSMIVKNVVFTSGDEAVVVLCSGDRSVDRSKLSAALGKNLRLASRDEVPRLTGFAAGGVPPFGHRGEVRVRVVADRSVLRFEEVVTSAGSPSSLLRIRTEDLLRLSGAEVLDVSRENR
jgi:Cys-tRNA(Pro) deacylase